MKRLVRAQAFGRADILSDLRFHGRKAVDHLAKVYLYPDHTARNHWKEEVLAHFSSVSTLKGTNRFPKLKDIYYNGCEGHLDTLSKTVRVFRKEYGEPTRKCKLQTLQMAVQDYFWWASKELNKSGRLIGSEAYQMMDSVESKYFGDE
ncbi:hypothetical protein [uncultured Duncaniella sp.]|uniref:hypothetical protein n=1 Tax=uncultured Duncaniella sp. TaxID=2768039 RepID=UPI002626F3B6|nr:hypothetical protein [uncultured Duncaniella sp.]